MPHHRAKAIVLATFNESALLLRNTNQSIHYRGWRLPRWGKKGQSSTWIWSIVGDFRRDLKLNIRRDRLRLIKETLVGTKRRVFFAIELTEDEADLLRTSRLNPEIETRLVHLDELDDLEGFGEREQQLLKALAE